MPNTWESFFNGHAPVYMDNVFTRNTLAEVDFLLEEFNLPAGSRLLDIGCGTGRHAVELARRGYRVTGVDLSAGMLAQARRAAAEAGVAIDFRQQDAATFMAEEPFDGAYCLCEGAFCLLGQDDDPLTRDLALLQHIADALRPGAPFLLTALLAFRQILRWARGEFAPGVFDPTTLVEHCAVTWDTAAGIGEAVVNERTYVPTELALLCRLAGFTVEHLWAGTAGNWNRQPITDPLEMEMMLVCRKAEG